MLTEEERMSLRRQFIQSPLSDDLKLASKAFVACSVLCEWKKQKNALEKELIKKRKFVDLMNNIPKSKRTTVTTPNPVFKNQKTVNYNDNTLGKPEVASSSTKTNLRLSFKVKQNKVVSIQKSDNINVIPCTSSSFKEAFENVRAKKRVKIEQAPLSKKRSENKYDVRAKKRVKVEQAQLPVVPIIDNINIPTDLKARLLNYNAVLVSKKILTATDVAKGNQRLSLPDSQIRNHDFLTEEEIKSLIYKAGEVVPHLSAKLIQPGGNECDISLARWRMRSKLVYNLLGFHKVVAEANLRANMPIEIYSFREGTQLFFAIIKVLA